MSRIRYIKPGFFVDDDLAACQPLARILFAGLWTIADREGRLEDRPGRIRNEILPNEDVDTSALLQELADHGSLIVRYEVDGKRYITIPGWAKHQHPHFREVPSTIPEPDEHNLGNAQAQPRQCQDTTQAMPSPARARRTGNGQRAMGNGERAMENGVRTLSDENESDVLCGELVTTASNNGDDFEAFWAAYPRKETRPRAASLFSHLKPGDQARALAACRHYGTWAARHPDEKLMLPSTFLSVAGRRWEEWEHGPPPGRDRAPARSGRQVDTSFGTLRELIEEEL